MLVLFSRQDGEAAFSPSGPSKGLQASGSEPGPVHKQKELDRLIRLFHVSFLLGLETPFAPRLLSSSITPLQVRFKPRWDAQRQQPANHQSPGHSWYPKLDMDVTLDPARQAYPRVQVDTTSSV